MSLRLVDCVPGTLVQATYIFSTPLISGEVYTIRELHRPPFFSAEHQKPLNDHTISLEEIADADNSKGEASRFCLRRFRLLPGPIAKAAREAADKIKTAA